MSYNLATAAWAAGINRSTVVRAIKSGKISATKCELGEWTDCAAPGAVQGRQRSDRGHQ